MNIWSSEKDFSIKHLLLLLREEFSENAYRVIDPDITDQSAVRLGDPADPDYSIYIYTYGQNKDSYGVHLEYQLQQQTPDSTEIYDNLSYDRLLDLLKLYFD